MKLTLVLAAWMIAATAGASLAHTNPGIVLNPFSAGDLKSSVQGGVSTSQIQTKTAALLPAAE